MQQNRQNSSEEAYVCVYLNIYRDLPKSRQKCTAHWLLFAVYSPLTLIFGGAPAVPLATYRLGGKTAILNMPQFLPPDQSVVTGGGHRGPSANQ